jgi:GT2 family glycosyltransferase
LRVLALPGHAAIPGRRANRTVGASGHALFKLLIRKAFTQPSALVVKRCVVDKIGLFDEAFVRVADTDFILRIATRYEFGFVPENLLLYYELPGSLKAQITL